MSNTTALCVAACLVAAGPAAVGAPAADWELRERDRERDIEVYVRPSGDGYGEFRGVTRVASTLSAFVALFRDVEHMPEWMDSTARVETLAIHDETEDISYTVIDLPWPLKDRDSILRTRLRQDPETLALSLSTLSVPDYLPVNDAYIRMPRLESVWRFTPLAGGLVEVEFRGRAELGGTLSGGMMKRIQARLLWKSPYRTLIALKQRIRAPEYQSARYDFVAEPGRPDRR